MAEILATIAEHVRGVVERRRRETPEALLRDRPLFGSPARQFAANLRGDRRRIIAEVKKASPSKGLIRADFDPVRIATDYAAHGASAVSVLTEPTFFDGGLEHLSAVRQAVDLPLLRKDFIVDDYQLLEARASGADAVLLIVAALAQNDLVRLRARASELGLAVLVEVHDEEELTRAIDSGAQVVGVNNRNLRTLSVDVNASRRLAGLMPAGVIAVSESGLSTHGELRELSSQGYRAFLVGERFMTAPDPSQAIAELLGGRESFLEDTPGSGDGSVLKK